MKRLGVDTSSLCGSLNVTVVTSVSKRACLSFPMFNSTNDAIYLPAQDGRRGGAAD